MTERPRGGRILTPTGKVVAMTTIASYLGGWLLGWVEMMTVAAGGILALVAAGLSVAGRRRMVVERHINGARVSVGEEAVATLTITNNGRRQLRTSVVEERIGGSKVDVAVPRLGSAEASTHHLELPTDRRGVVPIGPSRIGRSDPFGLVRWAAPHTAVDHLWVRPPITALAPIPTGHARDLEGATTDSSPAGDVSFHTLRDYQLGDDPRHVHWLSTARTGTLMVRHHVDSRIPELAVVLDTAAEVWDAESFEVAVEIAASVAVNARAHHLPTSLHVSETEATESGYDRATLHPSVDDLLDAFTLANIGSATSPSSPLQSLVEAATATHPGCSVAVVVTGDRGDSEVAALRPGPSNPQLMLVRVGPADHLDRGAAPTASRLTPTTGATRTLDVTSVDGFRTAWNREMA